MLIESPKSAYIKAIKASASTTTVTPLHTAAAQFPVQHILRQSTATTLQTLMTPLRALLHPALALYVWVCALGCGTVGWLGGMCRLQQLNCSEYGK